MEGSWGGSFPEVSFLAKVRDTVMCFPKFKNTWASSSTSLTSISSSVKWEESPVLQQQLLRGKGSQGPVGVRTAGAKQRLA